MVEKLHSRNCFIPLLDCGTNINYLIALKKNDV